MCDEHHALDVLNSFLASSLHLHSMSPSVIWFEFVAPWAHGHLAVHVSIPKLSIVGKEGL